MSEYFPIRGICVGCQSGTTCDVHQSRAILNCARFNSFGPHDHTVTFSQAPYFIVSRTYHGLCRDCEIRAICENAFETGGIWNCNQYR